MIKIYSTNWCGPCKLAKKLLDDLKLPYQDIDIEENNISRAKLSQLTGGFTVPQIIIKDKPIGGFDQLIKMHNEGKLKNINVSE
tara:strand:+ start:582 stop:833 length:252 start_codon:yes stop_codon:yes gene_type:complete